MEAPSCWPTLTVAEATPASCGATPKVPVLIDGAITRPMPMAATMSGPTTSGAFPVCRRAHAEGPGVDRRPDPQANADGGDDERADHAGGVPGVRAELGEPDH